MIIMGIDPGSAYTGYGLIQQEEDGWRSLHYGCIRTRRAQAFPEKLDQIYSQLKKIICEHRPDIVVVEKGFSGKNLRTAWIMGQVLGIAFLAATRASVPVLEYSPREIKLAVTGFGAASKEQVQYWVGQLLMIDEASLRPDVSDALAVALCHANRLNVPQE